MSSSEREARYLCLRLYEGFYRPGTALAVLAEKFFTRNVTAEIAIQHRVHQRIVGVQHYRHIPSEQYSCGLFGNAVCVCAKMLPGDQEMFIQFGRVEIVDHRPVVFENADRMLQFV